MFNFLCLVATYISFFGFAAAINEIVELSNLKAEERRERYRQLAYFRIQRERVKQRNRDNLWQEVSKHE